MYLQTATEDMTLINYTEEVCTRKFSKISILSQHNRLQSDVLTGNTGWKKRKKISYHSYLDYIITG